MPVYGAELQNKEDKRMHDFENSQIQMENSIKADVTQMYINQDGFVNAMMKPEFIECSFENKSITVAFPVLEWERNRAGYMHGGIIGAAFDFAMGLLTRFFSGQDFAPSIQLETVFIRPIPIGDVLLIKAKTNLSGRKLTHLYGEAFVKSSGKLAATATASYFNENISKREQTD